MKNKTLAITSSMLLTIIVLVIFDKVHCALNSCLDDDTGQRALNMLGIPILIVYCIVTWGVLYPFMLIIRKRAGIVLTPLFVAMPASFIFALIFHRPEIDGNFLNTLSNLGVWLFVPWYFGGLVANYLWPNTRIQVTPKSGAPDA